MTGSAVDSVVGRALTKRFGNHRALAAVDIELSSGSLCALLGPNGAGKSTLLGILSTLVRQTSGSVQYLTGGEPADNGDDLRRSIGVLAHSSFLYDQLSGRENLEFYGRLYGVDDPAARADELLSQVALERSARDRPAGTYSRGMRQRVAVARALLHNPSVLLLDEPFTGLDRAGIAALADTLTREKKRGRVLVVVTHDLDALADVTDHVVALKRGKVVVDEREDTGFAAAVLHDIYQTHCA